MDVGSETKMHLKEHVMWPATGSQIIQQCKMMSHVPESERKMAMDKLNRDKQYNNADEAMADLEK